MTVQVYKGAAPFGAPQATWAAALALVPSPMDDNYELVDTDGATYTTGVTVTKDPSAAHYALTFRGTDDAHRPTIHVDTAVGYAFYISLPQEGDTTFQYINFDGWNGGQKAIEWSTTDWVHDVRVYDCTFTMNGAGSGGYAIVGLGSRGVNFRAERCAFYGTAGHSFVPIQSTETSQFKLYDCVFGNTAVALGQTAISFRTGTTPTFECFRCTFQNAAAPNIYATVDPVFTAKFYSNVFDRCSNGSGATGIILDTLAGVVDCYFNTFVFDSENAAYAIYYKLPSAGSLRLKGNVFSIRATAALTVYGVLVNGVWQAKLFADYNDYYKRGGGGTELVARDVGTATDYATLAAWQAAQANDADAHAINTDPAFDDYAGRDYHIPDTSPCRGAAVDLGVTYDRDNVARPQIGDYDIGAYEALASAVTTYAMRAWDSGTVGWVRWAATDPTAVPLPGDTTPNYTGALSATSVQRVYVAPTPAYSYAMRARDSGTAGWVYWTTLDPTAVPLPGDTTPNYTGALSATSIQRIYL